MNKNNYDMSADDDDDDDAETRHPLYFCNFTGGDIY
jgi:hypothetical protein